MNEVQPLESEQVHGCLDLLSCLCDQLEKRLSTWQYQSSLVVWHFQQEHAGLTRNGGLPLPGLSGVLLSSRMVLTEMSPPRGQDLLWSGSA